MRMIAGLDRPTTGRVTVNGGDYRSAAAPMAELGVLLEAKAVHTGRSAKNHLLALAQTNGISRRRVDELIDLVGLQQVADTTVTEFVARASIRSVAVRSPEAAKLRDLLLATGLTGITVDDDRPDVLGVGGLTAEHIGTIAWQSHIPLYELTVQHASLEEAFMTLTQDSVEYRSTDHAAAVAA
jgi:hypothetical protein